MIAGYGTLLLSESLGKTVGEREAAMKASAWIPVRVDGYRRLYNLSPPHYKPSFRATADPVEKSAANVEPCAGCWFNGIAFEADESETALLDRREGIYRRTPVRLSRFDTGAPLGGGFVYVGPADSELVCRDPAKLLPRWLDLNYARVGAYRAGADFGRAFDETTFLADGATLVADRYRGLLGDLSRLE